MAPSTSSRSRKEKGSSSTSINEEKYRQLKRKMKDVLQEHDHLSSKLKKARSKISHLKREKDLLLDRLDRFEGPITSSSDSALSSLSETDSESDISSDGSQDLPSAKRQRTAEGATNLSQLPSREPSPPPSNARAKKGTTRKPFTSKLRKIQPVPRDEFGNPVLPLHLGITTLYALGTIVHDRKNFHTERYIYPVGYKASRTYASMVNPERGTVYTCSITDGGDGPRFNIVPEDAPEKAVTATSATGAWTAVIKVANALRKREHSNSASGPDYFGFAHPTIASLIQELPGVELCKNYVAQKFEEQEPIKRGGTKGDKSSTRQSSASPPDNPGLKPSAKKALMLPSNTGSAIASPRTIASDVPDFSETGSAIVDDLSLADSPYGSRSPVERGGGTDMDDSLEGNDLMAQALRSILGNGAGSARQVEEMRRDNGESSGLSD